MTPTLFIKRLNKYASMPKYMTKGAVAFDICSCENTVVYPAFVKNHLFTMQMEMVHTGLVFQIPRGYEIQVRQRSGLSLKYPNYIAIGTGTIDNDYRGEIMVPIVNWTEKAWEIHIGDRIAQCILNAVTQPVIIEKTELDQTERGTGGFGHTGI